MFGRLLTPISVVNNIKFVTERTAGPLVGKITEKHGRTVSNVCTLARITLN